MRKFYPIACVVLLLSLGLAACGDNTATPLPATTAAATTAPATTAAPTTAAATTAAPATAVPTTAVLTTAPATTVAATTAAPTTAVATTAAMTTAATTTVATTSAATTLASTTAVATAGAGSDLTYTDMTGFTGKLAKPAQKVFCLWTDCFDMLKELGMTPVGADTTVFNILLGSADTYPIVDKNNTVPLTGGTFSEPAIEDILKLQPDLIIGLAPTHTNIQQVLKDQIPVFLITSPDYQQMLTNLKIIGNLTGHSAEAEKAIAKFQTKLNAYKAKSPKNKQVMLLNTQDGKSFFVPTNKYLNCGLLNEVANCTWTSGSQFQESYANLLTYTFEQLLAADPEVIIGYKYPGAPSISEILKDSPLWKELKAVKNNQFYDLEAAIIQPGGTLGLGIFLDRTMKMLYPDVFPNPLP